MTKSELANQLRPYARKDAAFTDEELISSVMNEYRCCFDLEDGIALAADVTIIEEWCEKLEQFNRV
jgi:hypothetical protein